MGEALEAGYELAGIALCFVALSLLIPAKELTHAIASAIDFTLFGFTPLHGVAAALENKVVKVLDAAIRDVEAITAKFESGLIDAFGMLIALPLLLAFGVKAAFHYLWNSALKPVIHSIADPIKTTADAAKTAVDTLTGTVASNLAAAKDFARERANAARTDAESYVDTKVENAIGAIRGEINAAKNAAIQHADSAVSTLRDAENAALNSVSTIATAAANAAATAEATALSAAAGALTTAETFATAEAARAEAAAEAVALKAAAAVDLIAVGAAQDLSEIEGALGKLGLAALIASMPAVATLVHAISEEAGLGKAECRTKVKGICSTDPSLWGDLLAGLVAIGVAFNLRELYAIAEPLVAELAPVIAEAV